MTNRVKRECCFGFWLNPMNTDSVHIQKQSLAPHNYSPPFVFWFDFAFICSALQTCVDAPLFVLSNS